VQVVGGRTCSNLLRSDEAMLAMWRETNAAGLLIDRSLIRLLPSPYRHRSC